MKKSLIGILVMSVFLIGFCAEGMAISAYGDDLEGPPSKTERAKLRKRIETMRMWKLTKALDLDEKSASRIFPLLNEYSGKREEIESEIRNDMDSLKEALADKNESRIKSVMESLQGKHDALQRLGDEKRSRLRDVLTIEQQAKYLIFRMEFKREMRKMITEARIRKHKRGDRGRYREP